MLGPKASLIRSSRYQRMYPSNCSTNPSMVTAREAPAVEERLLEMPEEPFRGRVVRTAAFALIDRVNPFSLLMLIHPGHR